jgi:hypothetical protein
MHLSGLCYMYPAQCATCGVRGCQFSNGAQSCWCCYFSGYQRGISGTACLMMQALSADDTITSLSALAAATPQRYTTAINVTSDTPPKLNYTE